MHNFISGVKIIFMSMARKFLHVLVLKLRVLFGVYSLPFSKVKSRSQNLRTQIASSSLYILFLKAETKIRGKSFFISSHGFFQPFCFNLIKLREVQIKHYLLTPDLVNFVLYKF